MKRLRRIFESIVYVGMKPGANSASQRVRFRWLGPLRGPIVRFLNGRNPSDPLYLTNRTTGQKVRLAIFVMLPFAVVLAGVILAASGYFDDDVDLPPPTTPISNAEIAAENMPDLDKDMHLDTNKELQVLNVVVSAGNLSGTVKNTSNRLIANAEVIFDLADEHGSRAGAVNCRITRIEPQAKAPFTAVLPLKNAVYAVVREVRTQ
ncbi:conserved hypothetical protein [Candidatus Sulfopaludibacter sp. SbA3]|nr:conserved hypothetical protein [Candidatus Sulfopaludibacter sp. SbA3]